MKRRIGLYLMLAFFVIGSSLSVNLVAFAKMYISDSSAKSNNVHAQNYDGNYGKTVNSYLYEDGDGGIVRVEYIKESNSIVVENYSSSYKLLSSKTIPMELSLFGAFYAGKNYNYIVFGDNNIEENPSKEVYRIVQYDKNFTRINSYSMCGANTTKPFHAGSCRLSEYGNVLYIRTCHEMFKASDGLNHQANVMIVLQQSDCSLLYSFTGVYNISNGYVSHSFNQFINAETGRIVAVDHGDAYPRSVALVEYPLPAGEQDIFGTNAGAVKYKSMFSIMGATGDNATGVQVGGLECSKDNYMVAGSSIVQDNQSSNYATNIFLSVLSKDGVDSGKAVTKWITNYTNEDRVVATVPHMVKLDENRFMLLWEIKGDAEKTFESTFMDEDAAAGTWKNSKSLYVNWCGVYESGCVPMQGVNYVIVDGNGNMISDIMQMGGRLSDCKPVCHNGQVVWYVSDNEGFRFYTIRADGSFEPSVVGMKISTKGDWLTYEIISDEPGNSKVSLIGSLIEGMEYKISVPAEIKACGTVYKVTEIKEKAFFEDGNVVELNIGASVENVGKSAFQKASIRKLVIKSNDLRKIEPYAFNENFIEKLTINAPKLERIEEHAFEGNQFEKLELKLDNLNYIGKYAFANTVGKEIIIDCKSLQTIDKNAFYLTEPKKLTIKTPNLRKIGDHAFDGSSSLTGNKLVLKAKNLETIGNYAFCDAKIKNNLNLALPKLKKIGNHAFECNYIKKITISSKALESVGSYAFGRSTLRLKSVTLNAPNLKKIGKGAFNYNGYLNSIKITSKKLKSSSVGKNAFYHTGDSLVIHVPSQKVKAYKRFLKSKGNKNARVTK